MVSLGPVLSVERRGEVAALTDDGPAGLPGACGAAAVFPLSENRNVLHGEPAHLPQPAQGLQPDPGGQIQGEAPKWRRYAFVITLLTHTRSSSYGPCLNEMPALRTA